MKDQISGSARLEQLLTDREAYKQGLRYDSSANAEIATTLISFGINTVIQVIKIVLLIYTLKLVWSLIRLVDTYRKYRAKEAETSTSP